MAHQPEASLGRSSRNNNNVIPKPPRLASDNLQRTISDISLELTKELGFDNLKLQPISEVEDAKCECCGMSEECTPEYVSRVRDKFLGKWVCGLCAEAVKEELEKNGGNKKEEALSAHMSACVGFNKCGRAFPVLYQAEAMKEMLKKSKPEGRRGKSISPKEKGEKKGGIARSSSCMSAITKEMMMNDLTQAK